jgi:vitamin B12 transporter
MGGAFDRVRSDFHTNINVPDFFLITDQHFTTEKWGLFLNDTVTLGAVAVTPGLRYDRMHPVGDFISPSLGAAWALNEQTVLRAYAARGYGLPVIIPGSTQVKVGTLQLGVETSQSPYLWVKGTLFWNRLTDVQVTPDVLRKERKQGGEVEARTVPLFNTALSAAYTYVDARNMDSGEPLLNVPSQIVKLGLHYDDKRVIRGALLGRYVWSNGAPDNITKDKAIIWDLNLAGKVFSHRDYAAELFFSAHNLFNGAQFNSDVPGFENARRWLEGGIRFGF